MGAFVCVCVCACVCVWCVCVCVLARYASEEISVEEPLVVAPACAPSSSAYSPPFFAPAQLRSIPAITKAMKAILQDVPDDSVMPVKDAFVTWWLLACFAKQSSCNGCGVCFLACRWAEYSVKYYNQHSAELGCEV